MKTNNAVFDEKTQAKLDQLKAQYTDKKLSRSERKEAFSELMRVRYAADPRPSISVRKQAFLNMVLFFLDTLVFGCLTFAKEAMNDGIGGIVSAILLFAMVITVLVFCSVEKKYKKEIDDELSLNSKKRASELAGITIMIAAAVIGVIAFSFIGTTFTINNDNWLGLFCTAVFAYAFFEHLYFLSIEGKEPAEAEEE